MASITTCPYCGQDFSNTTKLTQHISSVHGSEALANLSAAQQQVAQQEAEAQQYLTWLQSYLYMASPNDFNKNGTVKSGSQAAQWLNYAADQIDAGASLIGLPMYNEYVGLMQDYSNLYGTTTTTEMTAEEKAYLESQTAYNQARIDEIMNSISQTGQMTPYQQAQLDLALKELEANIQQSGAGTALDWAELQLAKDRLAQETSIAQQQLGLSQQQLGLEYNQWKAELQASPSDWIERWYAERLAPGTTMPTYPAIGGYSSNLVAPTAPITTTPTATTPLTSGATGGVATESSQWGQTASQWGTPTTTTQSTYATQATGAGTAALPFSVPASIDTALTQATLGIAKSAGVNPAEYAALLGRIRGQFIQDIEHIQQMEAKGYDMDIKRAFIADCYDVDISVINAAAGASPTSGIRTDPIPYTAEGAINWTLYYAQERARITGEPLDPQWNPNVNIITSEGTLMPLEEWASTTKVNSWETDRDVAMRYAVGLASAIQQGLASRTAWSDAIQSGQFTNGMLMELFQAGRIPEEFLVENFGVTPMITTPSATPAVITPTTPVTTPLTYPTYTPTLTPQSPNQLYEGTTPLTPAPLTVAEQTMGIYGINPAQYAQYTTSPAPITPPTQTAPLTYTPPTQPAPLTPAATSLTPAQLAYQQLVSLTLASMKG